MNVFLRQTLECKPDAAWNALRQPRMLKEVSKPLMQVRESSPLPEYWDDNHAMPVSLWMFGIIPMGKRTIDVTLTERPGGVRMLIDQGESLSGPLGLLRNWDHRMAISPGPNGTTLYRDRLVVRAGILTFPMWLGMWIFWQYRAKRIAKIAKSWR